MMSRFAPALRKLARELDLPAGVRGAILMEMAADLEAVFEHHRGQGLDEAEAQRRAEEMLLGAPGLGSRLGRVHRHAARLWPHGRIVPAPVDLLLLLVAVTPIAAGSVAVGLRAATSSTSLLVWPLLAVGLTMVVVASVEAGRLLGGAPPRAHSLSLLPALAAVAVGLGLLGFATEVRAMAMAFSASAADAASVVRQVERFGEAGGLLLVGLLLGVAGSVAWFILLQRAASRVEREVDALLATDASAAAPDPSGVLPLRRRKHP